MEFAEGLVKRPIEACEVLANNMQVALAGLLEHIVALDHHHAVREHTCQHCRNPAEKTIRREIFGQMRTQCEGCGKWWTPEVPHPFKRDKPRKAAG